MRDRRDGGIDPLFLTFSDPVQGKGFVKIFNLTNQRNKDWGNANDAPCFAVQVLDASVYDQGRYVFEVSSKSSANDRYASRSFGQHGASLNFVLMGNGFDYQVASAT